VRECLCRAEQPLKKLISKSPGRTHWAITQRRFLIVSTASYCRPRSIRFGSAEKEWGSNSGIPVIQTAVSVISHERLPRFLWHGIGAQQEGLAILPLEFEHTLAAASLFSMLSGFFYGIHRPCCRMLQATMRRSRHRRFPKF
jgi:hypothetical protein